MKRLVTLLGLLCVLAQPLSAGPAEDSIVRQLRDQGFRNIKIERTWLGRVRITAESRRLEREIILNPATGEILRDYWEERGSASGASGIINPGQGGAKPGYDAEDDNDNRDDDDRDDDDRDDDADADNSGRGNASDRGDDGSDNDSSGSGGNSGSGGGDDDGDSDADD